jgi:hypothetical protein
VEAENRRSGRLTVKDSWLIKVPYESTDRSKRWGTNLVRNHSAHGWEALRRAWSRLWWISTRSLSFAQANLLEISLCPPARVKRCVSSS